MADVEETDGPEATAGAEPSNGLGQHAGATWRETWPPLSYWSRVAMVVIGIVIAVRILAALQNVLLIVLAAFVVALGLQPALQTLERRGMRRGGAMAVIVLVGLGLMMGAAVSIVPAVVEQAGNAIDRVPDVVAQVQARYPGVGDFLDRFQVGVGEGNGVDVFGVVGSAAQAIFNTITLLLLTPYFAVSLPSIKSGVFRLLRREHREDFVYVVNQASELTSNYILGNITISLIAGGVSFVGLTLIGIPYPLALAVWVALTDLIPAVGALIGAVPVLAVAALTGGEELIWALVLLIGYQQIENYVIAPRVMKRAVDLSPALVIVALIVGGTLAGIVGALLALPIAALVKIIVSEYLVRKRVESVRAENGVATKRPRRRRGKVGSRPLP